MQATSRPPRSRISCAPCGRSRPARALALAALLLTSAAAAQQSAHEAQLRELGARAHPRTEDDAEARAQDAARRATSRPGARSARQGARVIDDDFIVFGYLQSESQVYHLRWQALTHVGSRFVGFNSAGHLTGTSAFTGRSSYLRAGGAAEAAGVKVVLVLASFDDGPGGAIESVMTSPARRATLVGELVALLAADGYSHGVSLDLEFSWGPAVRDGITAFTHELRAGLDALGAGHELSVYTHAIFSANRWDMHPVTGMTPAIDYMLYSMYDWASGSTARAISDFDNCLGASGMRAYLDAGLPPEKLVPVISAYSRRWDGVSAYGGTGTNATSSGFTDALYDLTLNPNLSSFGQGYVRGDEAAWYRWHDGNWHVRTTEGLEGMEVEVRHALSFQDPSGTWSGRRLGGVGFWSLMWMAEFTSIDPRTGATVARTRTYPHVYQLCQEVFARPGTRRFVLEAFDGLDYRWRDPNESPDTVGDFDGDSSRALVASAFGAGNALRVVFDLEGQGANRAVLAHELLASPLAPGVPDRNAALGHFRASSRIEARVTISAPAPGYRARMLVIDSAGQLEASPPLALDGAGPRVLRWDLTDPGSVHAFATSEPAFASGDGLLATAATGIADIAFHGLVIEGDGPVQGALLIEEITYESVDPGGRSYRINEFRYADNALEFVEVHGPAGPLPIGLTLRLYDASDGSIAASIPVTGAIADSGNGQGFFVVGDPGVPQVDSSISFAAGRDDLSGLDPGALQLVDLFAGHVHDSLVYEAFGGLDELVRRETLRVTENGWPWIGEVASGHGPGGAPYTLGRFPDGYDTRRNHADFSFQEATPGAPNGDALALPAALDFEGPWQVGFQTYDVPRQVDPASAGLPPSPAGGRAWRCVDTAGGGVIGVVGDAALGVTRGLLVQGHVYVPGPGAPAQAVAVGLAGSQGSNFFTSTAAARSGYESGYWLVYENRAGVQLADGRPDHPGVWELVHATHDNMDGAPVELLARITDLDAGVTPGTWAHFTLALKPAEGGAVLAVQLEGREVYRGAVPEGGPTSGAFQVGFRENHPGPPAANEGTWVDGLRIDHALAPIEARDHDG